MAKRQMQAVVMEARKKRAGPGVNHQPRRPRAQFAGVGDEPPPTGTSASLRSGSARLISGPLS
jgi:hypothetical protein